jgi:hypothetical protein
MKKMTLFVFFLFFSVPAQQRGNGDRVDSFPNLSERQLLVVTNACRMAPVEYRNLYVGNYQVLLPAYYPAVRPLYWNLALNKASRFHSLDMAYVCGMKHPSCDGTAWDARIKSYYWKSSSIAENIATGNQTAVATLKQWILEVNPSTTPVPVDKDPGGADGHRKNIMSPGYRELGCGYAKGPINWTHFWTQDFAGGKPDFVSPLVSGCHFFIETGKTTFFVNYYDSSGVVPTEVSCIIDGQKTAMTLAMGAAGKGTYTLVQTKGTSCRRYFFSCQRSGTTYRYPEYGILSTSGEGTCAVDYTPPESLSVIFALRPASGKSGLRIDCPGKGMVGISGLSPVDYPATIILADLRGRPVLHKQLFAAAPGARHFITLPDHGSFNIAVVFVKTRGGSIVSELVAVR